MLKRSLIIALIVLGIGGLIWAGLFMRDMSLFAKGEREAAKRTETTRLNHILKNGDIIFQTSLSSQSKAIQLATGSKYSHMGIIYRNGEKLYVYEAVQPVKLTNLTDWINRGEKGKFVVKRLKNSETVLIPTNIDKMKSVGDKFLNKDYDIYFEWSDDKIYCSELVWKIYKEALDIEIGELEELRNFNLDEPIVKKKMQERYGDNIPLDEIVISPASMFSSENLKTVMKN
jgi:hypothetical protein